MKPFRAEIAYDPAVALDFFKSAGKPESIEEGAKIFGQKERDIPLLRRSKMYLLLKGEVELRTGKKAIGTVKAGEIFGELAGITHAPRTAAAVASSGLAGRVAGKLGRGGVFGEPPLVGEWVPVACATAETDCELLGIGRPAFLELVKVSPKFASTLLSALAERLRFLTAHLKPS